MTHFADGGITETVDFAYPDIEPYKFDDHIDMACQCQSKIWAWVYQPPAIDMDGFMVRCLIACWIFVPELRTLSMTEMAGRFGKKKQSLGRWVEDFKKTFPELNRIQHIRHD